ncbi:MAG TPA: hypothetical protein VFS53_07010 [Gemmatimonadota bacterium]|nr:hypothetical protein [Gemmatimonadota bacterium]
MRFPSAVSVAALLAVGCATVEIDDLSTPTPVPVGSCVTIGFLGGLDRWNDGSKAARRLALELHEPAGRRYAETFENRRLDVARAFVLLALDADRDGALSSAERRRARWVIYGQSLGGGAAVGLAWRLESLGVPVELLILLDSVSWYDEPIPGNVRLAAALYQDEGWIIRGESEPHLADPDRTRRIAEEFDYDRPPGSTISLEGLPWTKLVFRVAHSRMDRDPRVWGRARQLANEACEERGASVRTAGPSPRGDGSPQAESWATWSRSRSRTR